MISLPACSHSRNRLADVARQAEIDAERHVVAGLTADLVAIDRERISIELFDSPAARVAYMAIAVYRKQCPDARQCSAGLLQQFVSLTPELGHLFSDQVLAADELGDFLEGGHCYADMLPSNVALLREAQFRRERRAKLAELESLPRERFWREIREWSEESERAFSPQSRFESLTLGELMDRFDGEKPALIEDVARPGEVVNLVNKAKTNKTWTSYGLAWSVVGGLPWLGRFACRRGRVLIVDNELRRETIRFRLPRVGMAMGLSPAEHRDDVEVVALRGQEIDIHSLEGILTEKLKGKFSLIIIDALYKLIPEGASENDNAVMGRIYARLLKYAEITGAVIVVVHHSSKGDQTSKDISDVGAGAGAQSRAADTHIVTRPHERDGHVVIEVLARSFPPADPVVARWEFPLWVPVEGLDPSALKGRKTRGEERQAEKDREGCCEIEDALESHGGQGTTRQIRAWSGMGPDRMTRLLAAMVRDGTLTAESAIVRGNESTIYRLAGHPKGGRGLDVVCSTSDQGTTSGGTWSGRPLKRGAVHVPTDHDPDPGLFETDQEETDHVQDETAHLRPDGRRKPRKPR